MIDGAAVQLALRNRALALVVCTTGAISLAASATGFVRTTGSFLTDGFMVGMELTAAGFVTAGVNGQHTITAVTALTITCAGCAVDAAAGGRTLSVGIPAMRSWDNVELAPVAGRPYIEESFVPATNTLVAFPSNNGTVEETGLYVLRWYGVANTGLSIRKCVDALKLLFAPGTARTASTGDVVRVRSDHAPYAGQLLPDGQGFTCCTLTIPWRARTQNLIAA